MIIIIFILNFVLSDLNVQNKMSKYKVTIPKKVFLPDIMEYNPFQQQGQTNSEALHMPKNLYTWILLHFFCGRILKKNNRPTNPPNFLGQKGKQTFYS